MTDVVIEGEELQETGSIPRHRQRGWSGFLLVVKPEAVDSGLQKDFGSR